MAKRIDWIDIGKGIGIILVILGHMLNNSFIVSGIYAFHMPLFFILSGLVFNPKKENKFSVFFLKNIKSIFIPYLLCYLIFVLWNIFYSIVMHCNFDYKLYLLGIIEQSSSKGYPCFWFLSCIFCCRLMIYLIEKVRIKCFLYILTFSIGYIYIYIYAEKCSPWSFNVSLIAIQFVLTGIYFKDVILNFVNNKNIYIQSILFIILIIIVMYIGNINKVDMSKSIFSNFILFEIGAYLGSFAIIFLSNILTNTKFLKIVFIYIGQKSVFYYCLHFLIMSIAHAIISRMGFLGKYSNFVSIIFVIIFTTLLVIPVEKIYKLLINKLKF